MSWLPRWIFRAIAALAMVSLLATAKAAPAVPARPSSPRTLEQVFTELMSDDPATIEAAAAEIARRGTRNLVDTLQTFVLVAGLQQQVGDKAGLYVERMAKALARIGPSALPALQSALTQTKALEGSIAALAIGEIGPSAAPAAPALVRALAGETFLRGGARHALAAIGPGALPALRDGLKDPNADVRSNSAMAIGEIHADPARSVPALTAALRDTDGSVRTKAAEALAAFGVAARTAVPELLTAGDDSDNIDFATTLAVSIEGARSELTRALAAGRPPAAERAAFALALAKPPALTELTAAMASPLSATRKAATAALAAAGQGAVTALAAVTKVLDDPDPAIRLEALGVIRQIPAAAAPALPQITARLRDTDPKIRAQAAEILGAVARTPDEMRPVVPLLDDPVSDVRAGALYGLAQRSAGTASVPGLLKAVADRETPRPAGTPNRAAQAVVALGRVGPQAGPGVLRTFTSLLAQDDAELRLAAAVALGYWGPAAGPVVPDIARALRAESDPNSLRRYLKVLAGIGPAARAAQDAVQALTRHEDEAVREEATAALAAIRPR